MSLLSKMMFDARAGAQVATNLSADTNLQLRQTTRISAADARAWALKRPADGQLTALVDLPEAARLNVAAWLEALHPDVVELRTPAWSEAGMAAVGWPTGHAVLLRVLKALAESNVSTRLALHVSALTQDDLTVEALDRLTAEVGLDILDIVLRPVLGDAAPRLDRLAAATVVICQTGHALTATRLIPACVVPEGVDGEATFASERTAARQTFVPECTDCPARESGRCDGMVPDLLKATLAAGGTWAGWSTWAREREPVVVVPESQETLAEIALRLGLARVWRAALSEAEAEALGAHPPAGLLVIPCALTSAEAAPLGTQVLYLAPELADAEAARAADLVATSGDPEHRAVAYRELGTLLGHPMCCVTASLAAAPAPGADPEGLVGHALAVLRAARASQRLDARLNFGSPIDQASLVEYAPCAFDCAPSLSRIADLEAELARVAPERLATLQSLRVDAAMVFADGAHLAFRGAPQADGSLKNPVLVTGWDVSTAPGAAAQRALDTIASQLSGALALASSHPFDGPGGVVVTRADGTQELLQIGELAAHPEFPRLLVFSAQ